MELALASLGDLLPNPHTGISQTEAQRHRSFVDQGVLAERLGFHAIHLGEHHFSSYMLSAPAVVLAAIAERTSTIRLGTSVTLVGNNDPVRLAEDYSTVDLLSGGRVEIVSGRGAPFVATYHGFGQSVETARERYDENVRLLHRLLSETNVSWAGNFRSGFDDLTVRPRPLDHIPLWVGAGSRQSVHLAAELGAGLMLPSVFGSPELFRPIVEWYHEEWAAAGRPESEAKVGAISHTHVAQTVEEAKARWKPYYQNYWGFVGGLLLPAGYKWPPFEYDNLLSGPAVCGSPQSVIEQMGHWNEMLGLDRHLFMFDLGGIETELLTESLELFAAEAMPALSRM